MSNQGLSIFDDEPEGTGAKSAKQDSDATRVIPAVPVNAPAASPIPTVRRGGYDPAAVDARLQAMNADRSKLANDLTTAKRRVAELESEFERLKDDLDEAKNPSYAGLGGRASALLRLAEEEANEVRSSATRDAADIRSQAERDAEAIRAAASREADDMRTVQLKELDEQRARLVEQAKQERSSAQAEAEDLRAAAQREADQQRLAAEQETTELRTSVQREVEQKRAGVDREVQEARRMLAVEKERLAREATDHHNSAMAETSRLVEEAEQRAAAAEQRAKEAMATLAEQRSSTQHEAESLLVRARREAEQIVTTARTQAEAVSTNASAEAEREVAAIKAEVTRLTKRRDAITAQMASLSELVAGFIKDDEE